MIIRNINYQLSIINYELWIIYYVNYQTNPRPIPAIRFERYSSPKPLPAVLIVGGTRESEPHVPHEPWTAWIPASTEYRVQATEYSAEHRVKSTQSHSTEYH